MFPRQAPRQIIIDGTCSLAPLLYDSNGRIDAITGVRIGLLAATV